MAILKLKRLTGNRRTFQNSQTNFQILATPESPPAEKYGFEYISLPDITTENTAHTMSTVNTRLVKAE